MMSLLKTHMMFWSLAFLFFCGFVWVFGNVLLPFVAGISVAYLLNPVVERMTRHGLSRRMAVLAILLGFLVTIGVALAVLVPALVREVSGLIEALPGMVERLHSALEGQVQNMPSAFAALLQQDWADMLGSHLEQALSLSTGMLAGLLTGGQTIIGILAFLAVMPIVAFFMMKEWPDMVGTFKDLLPRRSAPVVLDLLSKLNHRLSGFIRGQLLVCLMLSIYYAVALSLVGLPYAVLVGVGAGVLSIIPYVGSIFGLVMSALLGVFQIPIDGGQTLMLALGVVALGQFVEGNFITPKIVGESVGLHPLWIMFALLAGGSLMGLLGMFIAVPVAAALAVLVEFLLAQYRNSPYYREGVGPKTKNETKPEKGA